MEEKLNEFHKNCGEILRLAVHLESHLDFFISNYFCFPQGYKTFLFEDLMLIKSNWGFGRKVVIFKEICKEEEIIEQEVKKIVDSINFVKEIRNKAAHWEGTISRGDEGIKLQKRTSIKYKKDELKLNSKLVKEVDENRICAIKGIAKIYSELSNPNRVKKPKVIN